MANNKDNYQLLIEKLDQFTRKYYLNQLIRGALYSIALIVLLFVAMNVLEHYFYFGMGGRKVLFYSFIGVSALALVGWVFKPLFQYFNLGKVISHEKAAFIIGEHFTDVKDKLLNILQLKKQSSNSSHAALINASINQKTEEIKPVPFKSAINLNQNKKYLRYALPPLLLLFVLLFAAPSIIRDSTSRLINNDKEFERAAPFSFLIEKENLSVIQFSDYLLKVKIDGEVLPNEVFIDIDNYHYRLTKEENNLFSYQFSNVQKDTDFRIFASGVESTDYTLNVLKKPNITGFEVKLDFPKYTQRKDEALANIGDLVVPAGTNIDWIFNSQNTDDIRIKFSRKGELIDANRFSDELFTYKKRVLRDENYKLFISNKDLPNADSVAYAISVIPDLNPTINVEQFKDSTDSKLLFFVGDASDDYGLVNLSFNYRINKNKGVQGQLNSLPMVKPNGKQVQYDHTWDLNDLELEPGDEVSYYFEVFDNDGVNGSKSARTNLMNYAKPTIKEFDEMAEKNNDEIKKNLEESLKESKDIKKDMKKLREKMLQKKEVDWQTRKEIEKLLDRKKELEEKIDQAKEDFKENMKNQEEMKKPSDNLLEKQEKVQKMFEELMSEEMKDLMKKIEELMQELEKDGALEMMEEMEMDDEEMEMELDRALELFKQLELELEMEKTIDKLEELAEEQEELSEETEKSDESKQEELKEKQEEINEKFEEIKEKMEEIEKKNEELEKPKDIEDQDEEMEDIQEDLDDSKEELDKKENSKASKSQKKASKKMKEMAANMAESMAGAEMEQMEEDMEALRQLLENLVELSFDQEGLMAYFGKTNINTPRYVDLVQDQYKLKDDFRLIEDSLQALSKRVFQIESFVTEKVTEIKSNMKGGLKQLEERKKPEAGEHQQRTMQNVNDLALMLSEVMNQMQQEMAGKMSGSQMCDKPGGKGGKKGKVPSDKISDAQGEMNKQMQKMKDALEKGKGKGKGPGSKEFAEMAKRQSELRKALKAKQQGLQEKGKGSKELQDIIDEMNKVETDLVNKQLSNEMLKRQQDILGRLLEAEKAEREREYEQKRKAEVGADKERKMPPSLEEYIKKREAEIEMYKAVSPSLKPYYKFLVEEYFKSLKKQ